MLMPAKVKYRKQQRGRMRGNAFRGGTLTFGEFGLQALEPGWLSSRQIEAGRITITRHMKRKGKLWIRTFPWKSVTKKPTEVRMGKGKGDPEFWVDVIRPGKILFELEGIDLGRGPRGHAPLRPQAAHQDAVHLPGSEGAQMKIKELKELSADELKHREAELVDQLFKLRFQKSLGQLESPMKVKNIKRDIARIKTLLNQATKATE